MEVIFCELPKGIGGRRNEAHAGIDCLLQPVPDISSQSLRTVRTERALSTTGGLWDYVWNVGVMRDSGRLYAFTKESLRLGVCLTYNYMNKNDFIFNGYRILC